MIVQRENAQLPLMLLLQFAQPALFFPHSAYSDVEPAFVPASNQRSLKVPLQALLLLIARQRLDAGQLRTRLNLRQASFELHWKLGTGPPIPDGKFSAVPVYLEKQSHGFHLSRKPNRRLYQLPRVPIKIPVSLLTM